MKKALLIVNPSSGGERARDYEAMAKAKLETFFDQVEVKHTEKQGDGVKFAKAAAQDHYHSVFVMGGDGTVNEGINGLAEADHKPIFGLFPLGTVNDLARALHIPLDPEAAIDGLNFSQVKPLDIGRINRTYFMNVVAIGVIPQAINKVASKDKTQWGALAYLVSGVKEAMNLQSHHFIIEVDGQKKESESTTILIGLTNSIGGFERILPDARVDDGVLHMIYLKDTNILDSLKAIPNLLVGVNESTDVVEYITFERAKIRLAKAETSLKVNVDGDEGDGLPIDLEILPSHLQVYHGKDL